MKTSTLRQLLLYKYRYWAGYGLVLGCAVFFLGWQLGSVAPGLSQAEMESAASHISLKGIKEMPLYPLQAIGQWGSMKLFDISPLTLRLPNVIIAATTAFILYHLLKRWFGKPSALLATAIFLSADWFLFVARSSTGSIELSFWLSLGLLSVMRLVEKKRLWTIITTVSFVALLFIPLGPYAAAGLAVTLLGIKTFRERIKNFGKPVLLVCSFLAALGLASFVFLGLEGEGIFRGSLGLSDVPNLADYGRNLFMSTSSLVAIIPWQNPEYGISGLFLIRFFEIIFVLFGVIMLWRTRVNRFNDVVFIVTIILVLASGLNREAASGAALLVPVMIFITAGLKHFTHRWKRTFPNNPYARMAAFVPVLTLLALTFGFHYTSYFVLWPNQTNTRAAFTEDFSLAKKELDRTDRLEGNCQVNTGNRALATLIIRSKKRCNTNVGVVIPPATPGVSKQGRTLISPDLDYKTVLDTNAAENSRALTAGTSGQSLRWVVIEQQ